MGPRVYIRQRLGARMHARVCIGRYIRSYIDSSDKNVLSILT